MKLLLLSEFFPDSELAEITGGVEARNFYLAKYFKGEATVLTSRNKKNDREKKIFNNRIIKVGPVYTYSQNASLIKRFWFGISCIFHSSLNFDVVEGTNFITHFAAILIGKLRGKKIVLWYPDVWLGEWIKNLGIKGIFGEILERFVLYIGRSTKFIAISEHTKSKLIKNHIPKDNISVVPCGIDEEEISKVQVGKKKYDLVCVNRLVKYKNTEKIIKALTSETLLIIGDGPERKNLERLIFDRHLSDKIKIIPKIRNHIGLLKQVASARLFVSASSVEGFNIASLEAASLGLPCLLSKISPHLEHEKNLGGCMLFENEIDLKRKIKEILKDKTIYGKFSGLNHRNAKKFLWKSIIEKDARLLL